MKDENAADPGEQQRPGCCPFGANDVSISNLPEYGTLFASVEIESNRDQEKFFGIAVIKEEVLRSSIPVSVVIDVNWQVFAHADSIPAAFEPLHVNGTVSSLLANAMARK